MFDSALIMAEALGLMLLSAVTIVLVWAVCGAVFCVVMHGTHCNCCRLGEAVQRWWRRKRGRSVA